MLSQLFVTWFDVAGHQRLKFFFSSMAFAMDISMGYPMHIILTFSSMGFAMLTSMGFPMLS